MLEFESCVGEGRKYTAQVYQPGGCNAKADCRYPVLCLHNGKETLERGNMKEGGRRAAGGERDTVI